MNFNNVDYFFVKKYNLDSVLVEVYINGKLNYSVNISFESLKKYKTSYLSLELLVLGKFFLFSKNYEVLSLLIFHIGDLDSKINFQNFLNSDPVNFNGLKYIFRKCYYLDRIWISVIIDGKFIHGFYISYEELEMYESKIINFDVLILSEFFLLTKNFKNLFLLFNSIKGYYYKKKLSKFLSVYCGKRSLIWVDYMKWVKKNSKKFSI